MLYHSTRSKETTVDSAQAVLNGLAPDGGLYMPEQLPVLDVEKCLQQSTIGMAQMIIGAVLPDIPEMDVLANRAYSGKFETEELTPTVDTGKFNVLELFRGPTSAFKDVALCMLPQLLTKARSVKGMQEDIMILTATSGDTGKAALEGFKDVDGIRICVFYPHGGVSAVQRAQMVTQEGKNVAVCAVEGNFDDAQTGVKKIFNDDEYAAKLMDIGVKLSSANSINIGRLVPQVAYYVYGYIKLVERGEIQNGDKINIVVPTGNFGNILAAYYAGQMGIPVRKFICASNENKVLTDFINTGVYNINRDFYLTNSPSMDILISSNLERLLYHLSGQNGEEIKALMEALEKDKKYTVSPKIKYALDDFYGGYADQERTNEAIGRMYKKHGYLMDTHTAVAYRVYQDYISYTGDQTPTLLASTASAYKFADSVVESIGLEKGENGFESVKKLCYETSVRIPAGLKDLENKEIRHTGVLDIPQMPDAVYECLK